MALICCWGIVVSSLASCGCICISRLSTRVLCHCFCDLGNRSTAQGLMWRFLGDTLIDFLSISAFGLFSYMISWFPFTPSIGRSDLTTQRGFTCGSIVTDSFPIKSCNVNWLDAVYFHLALPSCVCYSSGHTIFDRLGRRLAEYFFQSYRIYLYLYNSQFSTILYVTNIVVCLRDSLIALSLIFF